jgi:hypothetical protein
MRNNSLKFLWLQTLIGAVALSACTADPKKSAELALEHAAFLAPPAAKDVVEVRTALPQGEPYFQSLWKDGHDASLDPEAALDALNKARNKVQDLRLVKSTLFALVSADGKVIRTDQSQDMMAGKNLFETFGALREAASGKYTEARGSMPEARGVEGKPDGQWLAAAPVSADGKVRGLYVSGWSWALYTHRLESALQGHLIDLDKRDKPLVYVFVVVGKQAFGARITPLVNSEAIEKLDPMSHLGDADSYSTTLEITGRQFGVAFKKVPELGPDVAIGVLRSET